jgi:23S rRNA pseudouridine2605 synthase
MAGPNGASTKPHALVRWLSKYAVASRSEARAIVKAGRVSVGGRVVRDPEFPCHPARQEISVDGKRLSAPEKVYLAVHKPVGYITTARDPERRPTVYDLLPAGAPRVQAAGRLDADSSGLLVFTNDTDLAASLTEGSGQVEKEYLVRVKGVVRDEDAARFEKGLVLEGRRTRPARCQVLARENETTQLRIVLREGRNRQIRKMLDHLGYPVTSLHRSRIGAIRLGHLPPGKSRSLTRAEIQESKIERRCGRR